LSLIYESVTNKVLLIGKRDNNVYVLDISHATSNLECLLTKKMVIIGYGIEG